MKLSVLIGDLVRSRKVPDRETVQRRLKMSLEKVNRTYRSSILAPLIITRGDEFEGALKDAAACFKAFRDIENDLFPVQVRGGIGIGAIDTDFSKLVSEMDGPAFHLAREALKSAGRKSCLCLKTGDEKIDCSLNLLLRLYWAVKGGWTRRQREVANFYLSHSNLTHAEIARHFGVSQPAISKVISAANLQLIKEAEELLAQCLSEIKSACS